MSTEPTTDQKNKTVQTASSRTELPKVYDATEAETRWYAL